MQLNNEQPLFDLFDQLNIKSETASHRAVMTAADEAADDFDHNQWEFPVKNLFLYDKAKQFYLFVIHLDTPAVDLKALAKQVGAKQSFSFGKNDKLAEYLGVKPGSVTPYAVINDTGHNVKVFLDERLQNSQTISGHPLRNDQTTTISTTDLMKLYQHTGHTPEYIAIPLKEVSDLAA